MPVFASVLGEPVEQIDLETRHKMVQTVKYIYGKNPALINGDEMLIACVREQ